MMLLKASILVVDSSLRLVGQYAGKTSLTEDAKDEYIETLMRWEVLRLLSKT